MARIFIENIKARQIIDSRANPTLEVTVELNNGIKASASAPSGASTGKKEALELRDNNPDYLFSKSVLKAVKNVENIIAPALSGKSPFDLYNVDKIVEELDKTDNFSKLGANSSLCTSNAILNCAAKCLNVELYQYIGGIFANTLPIPMINIINGGCHSNNNLDIQEFMIVPVGFESFSGAIKASLEIFHKLKCILSKKGMSTNVGDEGGFAPNLNNTNEAIETILEAIELAKYSTNEVKIALDVAASELYKNGYYFIDDKKLSSCQMVDYLYDLTTQYPIISIEDGLSEDDCKGWKILNKLNCMLVGDDLFTTNIKYLKKGIEDEIANAILIKPNQIGNLSKTFDCIKLAKNNNYKTMISHRSGETENTLICDLAVATSSQFIKTGSLSRTDRTAKYNRLLLIEKQLNKNAKYFGTEIQI